MKALPLVLAAVAAAGCAPGLSTPAPADADVSASARLTAMDAAGRRLLGDVTPWTRADIDHVTLDLSRSADGTTLLELPVSATALGQAVTFSHLKRNTAYQVVAHAWADAAGTQPIDNGELDPASCTTVFTTGTDARLDIGPLKLRLRNKVFAGQAGNTGLTVIDGHVVDDPGPEAIAKP